MQQLLRKLSLQQINIDLHGLHVDEAIRLLDEQAESWIRLKGMLRMFLICTVSYTVPFAV